MLLFQFLIVSPVFVSCEDVNCLGCTRLFGQVLQCLHTTTAVPTHLHTWAIEQTGTKRRLMHYFHTQTGVNHKNIFVNKSSAFFQAEVSEKIMTYFERTILCCFIWFKTSIYLLDKGEGMWWEKENLILLIQDI